MICFGHHNQHNLKKLHSAWAALCIAINGHVKELTEKHASLKDFSWNSIQCNRSCGSSPHTDKSTTKVALIGCLDGASADFIVHTSLDQARFNLARNTVVFDPQIAHSTSGVSDNMIFVAFSSTREVEDQWKDMLKDLGFVAPAGAETLPVMASVDTNTGTPVMAPAGTKTAATTGVTASNDAKGRPQHPDTASPTSLSSTRTTLRLYAEAFTGQNPQIINFLIKEGKGCVEPLELQQQGDSRSFDLLCDDTFDLLVRLAWSGVVAVWGGAPPCAKYSSARERPGGPRPLRDPDNMNGLNLDTPDRQHDFQTSRLLHSRSCQIAQIVVNMGGYF